MSFENDAILARYMQGADNSRGGHAFTIRKPPLLVGEKHFWRGPSCHACYCQLADKRKHYCDGCKESGAAGRHAAMIAKMEAA